MLQREQFLVTQIYHFMKDCSFLLWWILLFEKDFSFNEVIDRFQVLFDKFLRFAMLTRWRFNMRLWFSVEKHDFVFAVNGNRWLTDCANVTLNKYIPEPGQTHFYALEKMKNYSFFPAETRQLPANFTQHEEWLFELGQEQWLFPFKKTFCVVDATCNLSDKVR